MIKPIYKISQISRNLLYKFLGTVLKIYLKVHGCEVKAGLKCKRFPVFRNIPRKNISIGNNVTIGYRITFYVSDSGKLIIGDNVNLTQDITISSIDKVEIGSHSLVAEFVSIRDGGHDFKIEKRINQQGYSRKAIKIGSDVWIGAGSRILKGSIIEEGCIIAANSVVLEKTKTTKHCIYGGAPIKEIGKRN